MDDTPDPPPPSLTDRIARFFEFVSDRVGGKRDGILPEDRKPLPAAPMMIQVLFRLARLERRLIALVAIARRKQAAAQAAPESSRPTLPPPPCPPAARRTPQPVAARAPSTRRGPFAPLLGAPPVPTRFNWLSDILAEAPVFRAELMRLLSDTELAALVAIEPRLGRVLRPMAHMLGVRSKPALIALHRDPERPRPPRAAGATSPRKSSRRPWKKRSGPMATDYPAQVAAFRAKPG